MSYAVRKDNKGWWSVSGPGDIGPGENYSETEPVPQPPTKAARLADLTAKYKADIADLNLAYLAAAAADGSNEAARVASVRQQITDRTTQYNADKQAIAGGSA
ncbi:hypothetical protein [Herbaspirillum seropedicae]|uniref:hypothetical protein n=1 Tax=Herbaspirillum seropedicae TaxID=964 RepID=UPI003FCCB64B